MELQLWLFMISFGTASSVFLLQKSTRFRTTLILTICLIFTFAAFTSWTSASRFFNLKLTLKIYSPKFDPKIASELLCVFIRRFMAFL